jgi:hypothetical protein
LTEDRLKHLDNLTAACRLLLQEVRSGNPADFTRFSEQFDEVFAELNTELLPESLSELEQRDIRRKLRNLERIRKQLIGELADMRTGLVRRLTDVSKGKQGLSAYKSTLKGDQRGAHRGEG